MRNKSHKETMMKIEKTEIKTRRMTRQMLMQQRATKRTGVMRMKIPRRLRLRVPQTRSTGRLRLKQ